MVAGYADPAWREIRRPVWLALSELWLDTELETADLERISRVLQESRLSELDLREAYVLHVAPVVYLNLWIPAGEWEGFDDEWLCEKILHNLHHRSRRIRFMAWFPLQRWAMTYASERHWVVLMRMMTEGRKS
jgi:hypothetical protein